MGESAEDLPNWRRCPAVITAFAIQPAGGSGISLSFGKRYHRRNVVKASVRKVGYADL